MKYRICCRSSREAHLSVSGFRTRRAVAGYCGHRRLFALVYGFGTIHVAAVGEVVYGSVLLICLADPLAVGLFVGRVFSEKTLA